MTNNPMQGVKKTMLWLSIGTLTYFFAQWLLTILVVWITDYAVAGDFALILSSSNVFYAIALFGMRPFQISDTQRQYSDRVYIQSRWITCVLGFAVCLVFATFGHFTPNQLACLLVFMLYRVTEAGMDVLHGMMQSACRMEIAGISLIVRGAASLALFCGALMLSRQLLFALAAMTVFSVVWLIFFEYPRAKKVSADYRQSESKIHLKTIFRLLLTCLPLLVGNLVYSLILYVPRYWIESMLGSEALGIYASISAPALIVPMLALYIYTPYMPAISQYHIEGKKKALNILLAKLVSVILAIGALICIAGYFFGGWGLTVLFNDPNMRGYSYLLLPILINVICTALVYFLNAVITSVRKTNILLAGSALAVIVCFLTTRAFVSGLGMNGASFALIAIQAVQIMALAAGYLVSSRLNRCRRSAP